MAYRYRYNGNSGVEFGFLRQNGKPWVANDGDEVDSPTEIADRRFTLITDTPADSIVKESDVVNSTEPIVNKPAMPENMSRRFAVDEIEEN